MTTDELIKLTEAFVGDTTVAALRRGSSPVIDVIANFTDEQYALLVRFMGGERPQPEVDVVRFRQDGNTLTNIDPIELESLPKTVEENGKTRRLTTAERWGQIEPNHDRPEREDPDKPLVLKGEFHGIELP